MTLGEIMQVLANLQGATAGSQYTAQAAQGAQQSAQDMQAAEYAKKMEEENSGGGIKAALPTIAGIAGSFIPGVGLVAGPALAAATAAATGQDPLMAGAGALGGGLMGAATKGLTGAATAGAQGATQGLAETGAQAGLEAATQQAGQLGTKFGADIANYAGQAGQAVNTGAIEAAAQGMAPNLAIKGAAQGAAGMAPQAAAQGAGVGLGGVQGLAANLNNMVMGATPQTAAGAGAGGAANTALNVGQTGGQLTLSGAAPTQQSVWQLMNQGAKDAAMTQLQNLPGYFAQGLTSNLLGAAGQGMYNRYAPIGATPGAGGGYIPAGPYGTNPYGYDPATQGAHPNMARMAQEDIPLKNQFMMGLGQGLMGLSNQYALDSQNKVEIPERPFGLNQATAASIEAPYREAAARKQQNAREDARFNAEMGMKQAEFGETVRSNKVTEKNQGERTQLERERLELERSESKEQAATRELNNKILQRNLENMETPEEARAGREIAMLADQARINASNASAAASRESMMTSQQERQFKEETKKYLLEQYEREGRAADAELARAERIANRYKDSDFQTYLADNSDNMTTNKLAALIISGLAAEIPGIDAKTAELMLSKLPIWTPENMMGGNMYRGQMGPGSALGEGPGNPVNNAFVSDEDWLKAQGIVSGGK